MTFNLFSIMLNLFLCIIVSLVGALLTTASKITRRTITQQSTKAKLERAIFFLSFSFGLHLTSFISIPSGGTCLSFPRLSIHSHSPSELSEDDAAAIFHRLPLHSASRLTDQVPVEIEIESEQLSQHTRALTRFRRVLTTHIVENVKVTL